MKIIKICFLSLAIFLNTSGACDTGGCDCNAEITCCPQQNSCNDVFGKSYYTGRSQADNLARRLISTTDKEHVFGKDKFYGLASIAFEYGQTFKSQNLGTWFSTNETNQMTYGLDYETDEIGSGYFDINAINFGVTSSGSITFCPSKLDFIADIFFYIGFDEFVKGAWFSIDIPITRTEWSLGLIDCINTTPTTSVYPENSVGEGNIAVPLALRTDTPMKAAFASNEGFGDVPALEYGKICGKQKNTQAAAVRLDLGYDLIRCPRYFWTISLDAVVPTGTAPNAEWLFNAVAGNSDRWECGVFTQAQVMCWQGCNKNVTLYGAGTFNHIFGHKNQRILGLSIPESTDAEKNWSQYLILKKFNQAEQAIGLERAINISTGDISVDAAISADILLAAELNCANWTYGIGWEFWARSQEKLECIKFSIPDNVYAIKGSTIWNGDSSDTDNNLVAPTTTISKNGEPVEISDTNFITTASFDPCPALHPSAYSNKVFFYINRNWQLCDCTPFMAAAGEVEFGQSNRAFTQWWVMLKLGIGF